MGRCTTIGACTLSAVEVCLLPVHVLWFPQSVRARAHFRVMKLEEMRAPRNAGQSFSGLYRLVNVGDGLSDASLAFVEVV